MEGVGMSTRLSRSGGDVESTSKCATFMNTNSSALPYASRVMRVLCRPLMWCAKSTPKAVPANIPNSCSSCAYAACASEVASMYRQEPRA
jgi:hypothetical protein